VTAYQQSSLFLLRQIYNVVNINRHSCSFILKDQQLIFCVNKIKRLLCFQKELFFCLKGNKEKINTNNKVGEPILIVA